MIPPQWFKLHPLDLFLDLFSIFINPGYLAGEAASWVTSSWIGFLTWFVICDSVHPSIFYHLPGARLQQQAKQGIRRIRVKE